MLRKKMAPLDISGDGSIDMEEFNEAVDLWVATRDRASRQSRIILGLVLLMLLLLGANFGLTYGVVHLAKDRTCLRPRSPKVENLQHYKFNECIMDFA